MNKENAAHIYSRVLFNMKNKILSFVTRWLELNTIILSEVNQAQKYKTNDLTLRWILKKLMS